MIKVKAELNTDTFKFNEFEVRLKGSNTQVHTEFICVLTEYLNIWKNKEFYDVHANINGILDCLYEVEPIITAEIIRKREHI